MIGSRIINAVLDAHNQVSEEMHMVIFLLYVTVRENLLPMSYYTNMIEAAMVMGSTFDFLFEKLDPKSFSVLQKTPSNVF